MRLLDLARHWATGTHSQYQARLRRITSFEHTFSLRILGSTILHVPPRDPLIPLMWLHEYESIRPPARGRRGRHTDPDAPRTFNTIRGFRSAVSYFLALDSVIRAPSTGVLDGSSFLHVSGRYTDSAIFSMFSSGLATRIGDEPKPSWILLVRHIQHLDEDLHLRYQAARSIQQRLEIAKAGFANLTFWLGWLRSREVFTLRWCDVTYLPLIDDLPPSFPRIGGLLYRLAAETKSSRHRRADVICATPTRSGFDLGTWFSRCISSAGLDLLTAQYDTSPIFTHPTGGSWTSHYFRTAYLFPMLRILQARGDPHLRPFTNTPGNRLEDKFWSMHSYRRGARSHVSKRRGPTHRKATETQVYEHARWTRKRSGEAVDIQYRDWTYADRVEITFLSM